jgi:hypothetical protein
MEGLDGFYILNKLRNQALRNQIFDLSQSLNSIGIAPVWLKGATELLKDDWADSARMMVDLDLWAPGGGDHKIITLLDAEGYTILDGYSDDLCDHHFAPRRKDFQPAVIELHRSIYGGSFTDILSDAEALQRVEWIDWEGNRIGRLCEPDRLMNSYIQCIDHHGNLNRKDDRRITAILNLGKTLDFLERFRAAAEETKSEFFKRLDTNVRHEEAGKFFSIMSAYFGLDVNLGIDGPFLKSIVFGSTYPRLVYARFFAAHVLDSVARGRLGPPKLWGSKLFGHIKILIDS